jgi:hypothetical protein
MSRLWIALVAAVATLGIVPAAALADSSNITSWTSNGQDGTRNDPPYVIYYGNPGPGTPDGTTLTVSGTATTDIPSVDIVCYFAAGVSPVVLAQNLPVSNGAFSTSSLPAEPSLKLVRGLSCGLRAIRAGTESTTEPSQYTGPQIPVSQAALPSYVTSAQQPRDFLLTGTTLSGTAQWNSAGSSGPTVAPLDASFGQPTNIAIDGMGSLFCSTTSSCATGIRSEVKVDGQNAYDAASVDNAFKSTENLANFPSLTAAANWDPTTGLVSSQSKEGWVVCPTYPPTISNCPTLRPAGVQLERDISMSDGGLVVTMTDTWSSVDGMPHSLDLLYDDVVAKGSGTRRGYQFPGQSGFTAYGAGATLPGPAAGPGSILIRTNMAANDGNHAESVGAITFSTPPADYVFAGNQELEEHQVLQIPAGGSAQLTYVYSTGYTIAAVQALAQAAQNRMLPVVAITSAANGATVSTPNLTVTGTASAGSGITSLVVAGQAVPVAHDGAWSASVTLSPGSNTVVATGADSTGHTAQSEVTIVYQPPPPVLPVLPVLPAPPLPGGEDQARALAARRQRPRGEHVSARRPRAAGGQQGRAVHLRGPVGLRRR